MVEGVFQALVVIVVVEFVCVFVPVELKLAFVNCN